jgi:hypothetical protein
MGYSIAAINVGGSLQRLLDSVIRIVPKIVVFLIILVIGYIVAKIIERAVAMILERAHFNRFAQRGVVGDALARSDYDASRFIARVVFYVIMLVTLQLAFDVFGRNPVSDVLRSVVAWLPRLVVAIIIVVIASAIAHAVKDVVSASLGGVAYGRVVANAAAAFIVILGVIAALNQMGIATSVTEPLLIIGLATIGAILAIGLGGGLVKPMQHRWEKILSAGERDLQRIRGQAYERGREDAMRGGGVPAEGSPGETGTRGRGMTTEPHETPSRPGGEPMP